MTGTLMETYLGRDAGQRVLGGRRHSVLIAERVARLTALAGAPQVDPDLNVGWSAG
jgi:hypothetical protein